MRGRMAGAVGGVAALVVVGASWAQPAIPNGVFVKESNGTVWLVLDGQRVNVPIWAASDEQIAAIPASDRWLVPVSASDLSPGDRPSWVADSPPPPDVEILTDVAGQRATGDFGGSSIRVTVKEMTVTKTLPEAPPESRFGSPMPAVTASGKFVVVLVEVENVSRQPACCLPGFRLQDSRERAFSGEVNRADNRVKQAARTIYPLRLFQGDLQPNMPVAHVLVYDVPSDARGFKITSR